MDTKRKRNIQVDVDNTVFIDIDCTGNEEPTATISPSKLKEEQKVSYESIDVELSSQEHNVKEEKQPMQYSSGASSNDTRIDDEDDDKDEYYSATEEPPIAITPNRVIEDVDDYDNYSTYVTHIKRTLSGLKEEEEDKDLVTITDNSNNNSNRCSERDTKYTNLKYTKDDITILDDLFESDDQEQDQDEEDIKITKVLKVSKDSSPTKSSCTINTSPTQSPSTPTTTSLEITVSPPNSPPSPLSISLTQPTKVKIQKPSKEEFQQVLQRELGTIVPLYEITKLYYYTNANIRESLALGRVIRQRLLEELRPGSTTENKKKSKKNNNNNNNNDDEDDDSDIEDDNDDEYKEDKWWKNINGDFGTEQGSVMSWGEDHWAKLLIVLGECKIDLLPNVTLGNNEPLYFVKSNSSDEHPPESIIAHSQITNRILGYLSLPRFPEDLNVSVFPLLRTGYIRLLGKSQVHGYKSEFPDTRAKVEVYLTSKARVIVNVDKTKPDANDSVEFTNRIQKLLIFLEQILGNGQVPTVEGEAKVAQYNSIDDLEFEHSDLEEGKPHSFFVGNLMKHQRQGLWWMKNREQVPENTYDESIVKYWLIYSFQDNSKLYYNLYSDKISLNKPTSMHKIAGGLLCDDMGLGKTVMCISLIVSNHPEFTPSPQHTEIQKTIQRNVASTQLNHGSVRMPRNQMYKSTLIICPLSLVHQWKAEIEKFTKPNMVTVYVYTGPKRRANLASKNFALYDVVITTPGNFSDEFNHYTKYGGAPLHDHYWWRVIVDEGHCIKKKTNLFYAIQNIRTVNRWVITGTPVQNDLDELYPLLHFLGIRPIAATEANWKRYIVKHKDIPLLRATLKPILLRRLKSRITDIKIPPKKIVDVEMDFNLKEHQYYSILFQEAKELIDFWEANGGTSKNMACALILLTRLRQCCDHKSLIYDRFARLEDENACFSCNDIPIDNEKYQHSCGTVYCKTCLEENMAMAEARRTEFVCDSCIQPIEDADEDELQEDYLEDEIQDKPKRNRNNNQNNRNNNNNNNQNNVKFEGKKANVNRDDFDGEEEEENEEELQSLQTFRERVRKRLLSLFDGDIRQIENELHTQSSTKLIRLMAEIKVVLQDERDAKIIIFSQWTQMLDLVAEQLNLQGLGGDFARFDGRPNHAEKIRGIEEFQSDTGVRILLVSLKSGGVGLNLNRANKVFLIDPWWNLSSENQAIDRAHRIGQNRPVVVKRFIIRHSVETRMIKLQESKQSLTNAIFGSKYDPNLSVEKVKLSLEDLQEIFKGFEGTANIQVNQLSAHQLQKLLENQIRQENKHILYELKQEMENENLLNLDINNNNNIINNYNNNSIKNEYKPTTYNNNINNSNSVKNEFKQTKNHNDIMNNNNTKVNIKNEQTTPIKPINQKGCETPLLNHNCPSKKSPPSSQQYINIDNDQENNRNGMNTINHSNINNNINVVIKNNQNTNTPIKRSNPTSDIIELD